MMKEEKKKQAYHVGEVVLILLVTLTIGEFLMGYFVPYWAAPLLAVATLKAFFIVRDYMHIGRLFAGDEAEEHA
jgi:hypothetical protein